MGTLLMLLGGILYLASFFCGIIVLIDAFKNEIWKGVVYLICGLYALYYLFWGVVAAATHIFVDPNSALPVLGASGAIGGVLGAYFLLFPGNRIEIMGGSGVRLQNAVALCEAAGLGAIHSSMRRPLAREDATVHVLPDALPPYEVREEDVRALISALKKSAEKTAANRPQP